MLVAERMALTKILTRDGAAEEKLMRIFKGDEDWGDFGSRHRAS